MSPTNLAYEGQCHSCSGPVYVAICFDGRWRTFDMDDYPVAEVGVWAWRRRVGMQEQSIVPGKVLHRCAAYYEQRTSWARDPIWSDRSTGRAQYSPVRNRCD